MKPLLVLVGTVGLLFLAAGFAAVQQSVSSPGSVQIAVLDETTWDGFVPAGKEVDAIYGDIVLRNGCITAVIAQPIPTRHANMTVRDVAGALIDLTTVESGSDQLAAFYPGKKVYQYRQAAARDSAGNTLPLSTPVTRSERLSVSVIAEATPERPEAEVLYQLGPDEPFITVTTRFTNRSDAMQAVLLEDDFRVDGGKEDSRRTPNGVEDRFWIEDRYWDQAYGVDSAGYQLQLTSDSRVTSIVYTNAQGETRLTLAPGQSREFQRRVYAATNRPGVNAIALKLTPDNSTSVKFLLKNARQLPVPRATIEFKRGNDVYGSARTSPDGTATVVLPQGPFTADVIWQGRTIASKLVVPDRQSEVTWNVDLDPGVVDVTVRDGRGAAIPCKIEFKSPPDVTPLNFGPETGEFAVRNLAYSHNGRFHQSLPPGKYQVLVSHGPEFDSATSELVVAAGETIPLTITLNRSVETPGWISGDFHSHSSPSGDNTSSQLGRVLNLVAEQIEFAPCTEHNRVSTYAPHIQKLGISGELATVSGIELTSTPLPLNHQNAFPMRMVPRTQDGGGPTAGPDLETQIERLALHDNRSHKLIQVNHPDMGWMFYDKDGDGKPDQGFERAFPWMDVVEVHPIDRVLDLAPFTTIEGKQYHNTIFNWLQLLNQGFRVYGVVNTDAHYNFHGSGWLRNWIQSSTDDPAKIDPLEIVRAAEQGRIVMSNGPYLEVTAFESGNPRPHVAGEDFTARSRKVSLKVRVQCPNWLDVNRVFVLVNGRAHRDHNYSRDTSPHLFRSGVVKFDQTLDLELNADAHLIVATGQSGGTLAAIYTGEAARFQPAAMTNPIFVDVEGDGFLPNQDTLDSPLPTRFPLPQ